MKKQALSFYAGVFFISGLVMALQILQSRIFSVTSWYHLSFLVISMAMFGLTLGALKIYRMDEKYLRENYGLVARKHCMAFGFFIIIALITQLFVPIISTNIVKTLLTLPFTAIATSAAYYHAGVAITVCLTRSPFPVGKVYGIDLLGAGLGCIAALILMETIDTPSALIFLSGVAFISALLFPAPKDSEKTVKIGNHNYHLKNTALIFLVATFLVGSLNVILPKPIFYPFWVKNTLMTWNNINYEEWNSISRVTVMRELKDHRPFVWGPSPKFPTEMKATTQMLIIDGDAGTPITKFDGDFSKHKYLEYDVTNLAYTLPDVEKAAIIGVGGGRDLMSAKYFGVEKVTALDVNPVQVKLLLDHPEYREYSNLYKLPGVTILNEEARSWFRHNEEKIDLVQMSLIDTWAATGAGAFALSENGLYTVEAWAIFMNDLSEHGVFTVSRWSSDALSDGGRTLSVAIATLFKQGVENPRDHIVLANSGLIVTVILSKNPFTKKQLAAIHKTAKEKDYTLVMVPDGPEPEGILGKLIKAKNVDDLHDISDKEFFDVSPSTDMRPFFFNQARIERPLDILNLTMTAESAVNGVTYGQASATMNLYIIILFSVAMVVFTIIMPLLKTIENKTSVFVQAGTFYFIMIGLGFMLIEISLLQALGVFLGHPIYGLSVLLFSLIISAGIGSLISDKLPLNTLFSQLSWCILTCVYGISLSLLLPGIFDAHAESEIALRILISIVMTAPAGILMGFGFPTGLSLTEKHDTRATSWFWGINGAAGVLGSSIAIALNISLGIDQTLVIGSFCYALLALSFLMFFSIKNKKNA